MTPAYAHYKSACTGIHAYTMHCEYSYYTENCIMVYLYTQHTREPLCMCTMYDIPSSCNSSHVVQNHILFSCSLLSTSYVCPLSVAAWLRRQIYSVIMCSCRIIFIDQGTSMPQSRLYLKCPCCSRTHDFICRIRKELLFINSSAVVVVEFSHSANVAFS